MDWILTIPLGEVVTGLGEVAGLLHGSGLLDRLLGGDLLGGDLLDGLLGRGGSLLGGTEPLLRGRGLLGRGRGLLEERVDLEGSHLCAKGGCG